MQGATAFAALAGYVAFFHTSRHSGIHALGSDVHGNRLAIQRSARTSASAMAVSKLLVLFVGVLAVPFSVQVLVHILGIDALKSDTDPLTDLPEPPRLQPVGPHAWRPSRSATARRVLTVVMVDLDDFKRVNDTAGHAAGDQTLIEIGGILRRTRRSDSITARIGGEEFVVAVVGTEQAAIGIAERLRREIAATTWNVTASVGVATASLSRVPATGVRALVQDLVESADRAMYQAKRAGGDQRATSPVARARPTSRTRSRARRRPPTETLPGPPPSAPCPATTPASTTAAASMDPTPAKTRAAPTGIPPEIVNPMPTTVTTAKKRL